MWIELKEWKSVPKKSLEFFFSAFPTVVEVSGQELGSAVRVRCILDK